MRIACYRIVHSWYVEMQDIGGSLAAMKDSYRAGRED
jgi:hypothetical protein